MYPKSQPIIFLFLFSLHFINANGQKLPGVHCDFAYLSGNKILQELFVESDSVFTTALRIKCYKLNNTDSILLYEIKYPRKQIVKGYQKFNIELTQNDRNVFLLQDFKSTLRRIKTFPAGNYKIYVDFLKGDSVRRFFFLKIEDSVLAVDGFVKQSLNSCFLPEKKTMLLGVGFSADNPDGGKTKLLGEKNRQARLKKFMTKNKLSYQPVRRQNKEYWAIYDRDWFIGYYEVDTGKAMSQKIMKERRLLSSGDIKGLTKLDIENTQSLFSQVKDIKRDKKDNDEVVGEIGLTGTAGSDQEEMSENENNFYELRGDIQVPIFDIPVNLQGYYTSQDRNRDAKSSYIRMHYDNAKAKEKLEKMLGGYKNKYNDTRGRVSGTSGVYNMLIWQLKNQKSVLLKEIQDETGVGDVSKESLNSPAFKRHLSERVTKGIDSSDSGDAVAKANKAKDSVDRIYSSAKAKMDEIERMEEKIEKYNKLLEQYNNTIKFDSALVYSKIKDISGGEELTYKQLAKKASGILPTEKATSFISGLTSMDIGIFSKDISSYTMAGQTMKGIDVGYDFGICEAGLTLGKAQYINREGYTDKYTTYSGRMSKAISKGNKVHLFYYGYTPDRKMLQEDFYKDVDVSLPGFKTNVHIVSAKYDYSFKPNIRGDVEVATSFRKTNEFSKPENKLNDKLAYNANIATTIPKTTIQIQAAYKHVGLNFENNSLPVSFSGTNHYQISSDGVFLKSLLGLGAEFNYLEQYSFSYKGGNMKWGFSVKLNSKRYPSLSFSYKPFSTFRSYNDTLNIPQRPLLGETITGKAVYTIKRKTYSIRFNAVYNQNISEMDTMKYSSKVFQFNCFLMKGKHNAGLNAGMNTMEGGDVPDMHSNVKFIGGSYGTSLGKSLMASVSYNTGFSKEGLSRMGINSSFVYRLDKQKVFLTLSMRYLNYKIPEASPWKEIYGGSLDITWQFKAKVSEKNNF